MSNTTTSFDITITADNIWAGSGTYDHTDDGKVVSGSIRDCSAVLGGEQDKADEIYDAIVDAITDMDAPANGSVEIDGTDYAWTLAPRGMTEREAVEFVRSHSDDDNLTDAELTPVFAALYDRQPDAEDVAAGLWSHCVAAAE